MRDNYNISKNYKKKRHKARKTSKKPNCKSPRINGPLKRNTLLTTQIHLHKMQMNRDDRNKGNMSSMKVRPLILLRSKPSINKISEHDSCIFYGNHLLFFNVFLSQVVFEFQAFHIIFSRNISGYTNKQFQSKFYNSYINFCYY